MRVLFKDETDGTTFVMDVVNAAYDPGHKVLFCISPSIGDAAAIPNMSLGMAESIIHDLYKTGKADLTDYPATLFTRTQSDCHCCEDNHDHTPHRTIVFPHF